MENSFLLPTATGLKSTESPVWLLEMLLRRVAGESPSSVCLLDPPTINTPFSVISALWDIGLWDCLLGGDRGLFIFS